MKNRTQSFASRAALVLAVMALCIAPVAAQQQITPPPPILLNGSNSTRTTINNGPGEQNDPHVSGDLVSYTNGTAVGGQSIHYYRFSTATDASIPTPAEASDLLSDVSDSKIVFTRIAPDRNAIFVFDSSLGTTTEVAPTAGSNRLGPAIGASTIAYVEFDAGGNGSIFAANITGGGAVQLSSGNGSAGNPSVSSTGDQVIWEQCSGATCDVMTSVLSGGVWGPATVVVSGASNPDTDGSVVVFDALVAGSVTDRDVFIVSGGVTTQLEVPGTQVNPSINNGVIAFESVAVTATNADIFVYVIATNTLYQITNTPTINEQLNDVSALPNGDVRVVYAANDGLLGDYNVYATTFTPASAYHVCLLYDPLVAKKAGTTYGIKLQLCDSNGNNLSSPDIALHATGVTRTSNDAPGPLDDTGNANPDFDFRYDSSLQGYIFNLSLQCQGKQCFSTGSYNLNFTVNGGSTLYSAPFAVK